MKHVLSLLLAVSLLSGCTVHPIVAGGAAGGIAGAGTGWAIGTVLANGDVGASALLGTAIGIPAGMAIGAVYDYYSDEKVRGRKRDQIRENQAEYFARQREIDDYRERLRNEAPVGNPSEELKEYRYLGPSLGNYYR